MCRRDRAKSTGYIICQLDNMIKNHELHRTLWCFNNILPYYHIICYITYTCINCKHQIIRLENWMVIELFAVIISLVIGIICVKPFGSIIIDTMCIRYSDCTELFNSFNFFFEQADRMVRMVLVMYHYKICPRCVHCGILPIKVRRKKFQWNKSPQ